MDCLPQIGSDSHVANNMKLSIFVDSLTFLQAPPAGQILLVDDQILAKPTTSPSALAVLYVSCQCVKGGIPTHDSKMVKIVNSIPAKHQHVSIVIVNLLSLAFSI